MKKVKLCVTQTAIINEKDLMDLYPNCCDTFEETLDFAFSELGMEELCEDLGISYDESYTMTEIKD